MWVDNFFGGIAQACVRKPPTIFQYITKELELANYLDFFVSFFVKEKRKREVHFKLW